MTEQEQYEDAMNSLIAYEAEIKEHNDLLVKDFDCEDFREIIDDIIIDGKMEWVDKPKFKPENNPDKYGIFTLEFIDQRTVGMEGDSFEGFLYVKIKGYSKYLKIPYSC